ncbi:MAG: nucleotidyltransferase domain-containing protein [Deltaproteobacteria bacterium]|nr:nucleotidyltransferase domain-containing protein [Deltaproteobacteria bacterium]MBI2342408.1 nucleotidyltransferase domain-containing protein [Deltaproteobacteria bacterium]
MLYLDKAKLNVFLKSNGLNIARLAKRCGVSRQSIYNMLGGETVFNTIFERIVTYLNIHYSMITEEMKHADFITESFPDKIKLAALKLSAFAEKNSADLILFGSRAAGKKGIRHDFDFAINFHKKANDKGLKLLRQSIMDGVFPYRIDVVNLNSAPEWFKASIKGDIVYLRKEG